MKIAIYLNSLDEEYQLSVVRGMRAEAARAGARIFCMQGGRYAARNCLDVDGVVILSSVVLSHTKRGEARWIRETAGSKPCVSLGDRARGIPSIVIDAEQSLRQIMSHLLHAHGYRRFLYIAGPREHRDNILRERIFRESIEEARAAGIEIEATIKEGGFREPRAQRVVWEYIAANLNHPVDAIVAANDNMAIGAIKAIRARADPRWDNCAVTGFDDIPQARLEYRPLTTVRQPIEELGRLGFQAIRSLIEGKQIPSVTRIPCEPIIRESCGCRAVGEPVFLSVEHAKSAVYRGMIQERHLQSVTGFGQRLTTANTIREIIDTLREFLDDVGARTYILALYPRNAPPREKIEIVYSRTDGEESNEPEHTTLKDFLARDVDDSSKSLRASCVNMLRYGSEEIGVVMYEAEQDAQPHLCNANIFVANAVKRVLILEDEKRRALMLEEKIRERTKDIVAANRKLKKESRLRLAVESEVLRISELERLRFSLDLHDDICQRLAGISMYAKSLARGADLSELARMIDETLTRTRQYAHDSFPIELDSIGLAEAVDALCRSIERQTGCVCACVWNVPPDINLSESSKINLYRIMQEALNNVVKHSRATKIRVSADAREDGLLVRIRDNGRGIPPKEERESPEGIRRKPHIGIGLKSMEYRAHKIGAKFLFSSNPRDGTLVEIQLPRDAGIERERLTEES